MTLLRGKSNLVQVFDSYAGEVESSFDLSETISEPIRGLHTISKSNNSLVEARHIVVDEAAQAYTLDHESGSIDPLFKLKGNFVSKTYMLNSKALAKTSLRGAN